MMEGVWWHLSSSEYDGRCYLSSSENGSRCPLVLLSSGSDERFRTLPSESVPSSSSLENDANGDLLLRHHFRLQRIH